MTWLAWRQFRANAVLAILFTVAVVIVLVATRGHIAHIGDPDKLSTGYKSLRLLGTALIGIPAFIGAFWGAPLLAHELETGTHRLAWTQTVTRRRWLATKLAVTSLAAVAITATFSLVFTWWSLPLDRFFGNRIGTANFGQRGVVPIAYAVFALALGTLAGTMIRRTLPAMAATLAGFLAARFAFQTFVRSHLLETVTVTLPNNLFGQREGNPTTGGGWIISSKTVDRPDTPSPTRRSTGSSAIPATSRTRRPPATSPLRRPASDSTTWSACTPQPVLVHASTGSSKLPAPRPRTHRSLLLVDPPPHGMTSETTSSETPLPPGVRAV